MDFFLYLKNHENPTKRDRRTRPPLKFRYSPTQKKVLHKSEGKMPKKMKMTLQRAENLVHVKQHYGDSICKKIFFLF